MPAQKPDFSLIQKYAKAGPRYTSYPTAPLFSADFGHKQYLQEIQKSNQAENQSPLSLYFHFPFCESLCTFCGCNMKVTHNRTQIAEYNQYLVKEMQILSPHLSSNRKVKQLHFGGGTPSYLLPEEILTVGKSIQKYFDWDSDLEASVEIDPRGLRLAHLQAFKSLGFTRLSMGVQDFNPLVQQAINRIQSEEITRQSVNWARELGFKSINLDLIYGLPHQKVETFSETLEKIISIRPERVALFQYAHVPWLKPHQQLMDSFPTAEVKLEIFKISVEKLMAAGYEYIGMDHFALPADELSVAQKNGSLIRNFQGYSTGAGCDLYGLGVSAIGQLPNTYQQNKKDLPSYYQALDQGHLATQVGYRMNQDDQLRRDVIMRLMCQLGLDIGFIEQKHQIVFADYFADSLSKLRLLEADGLVSIDSRQIKVLEPGRWVLRNIAMCFDAYLDQMKTEKPVFSKTL